MFVVRRVSPITVDGSKHDVMNMQTTTDLIQRLRKRAEIRRQITTRRSVQNSEPDRLADLLEEAADALEDLLNERLNS